MKKLIKVLSVFFIVMALIIPLCSLCAFADDGPSRTLTSDDLIYTVKNGKAVICGTITELSGNIVIPSKLDGYTVVGIDHLFSEYCENMTSLTLPATLKLLNLATFELGFPNLKEMHFASFKQYCEIDFKHKCILNPLLRFDLYAGGVKFKLNGDIVIPEGVEEIGTGAFCGIYMGIDSITVPTTLKKINEDAFYYTDTIPRLNVKDLTAWCKVEVSDPEAGIFYNDLYVGGTKVTDFEIPEGVTEIKGGVFSGCSGITSVTLTESVTKIDTMAFLNCSELKSVKIPDSVTTIGRFAFKGCSALTDIVIPESVTQIGEGAFESCSTLTNIELPSNIVRVNDSTFAGCRSLISVDIPAGVEKIGYMAFANCTALESVKISSGVTKICEEAFLNCDSLKTIVIPGTIKEIDDNAFKDSNNLAIVTLEDGVEQINDGAFADCANLKLINIPNSVTKIHENAFVRCNGLAIRTRADSYAYEFAKDTIQIILVEDKAEAEVSLPDVADEPKTSPLWYIIPICAVVVIAVISLVIVTKKK